MKTKEECLAIVERTLDETLPKATERPAVLSEAMRYAVGTGGKRIRPLICLAAAEAVGGSAVDAAYPAAAIEMLHNYTLVHDDLPAMDNDTLRRFALNLGLAFQYEDDLLDGDSPYPKEETERLVAETTAAAVAALAELPGDTAFLSALARKLVGRTV